MAIELDNSFTVPVPPEQAWDVLLDVAGKETRGAGTASAKVNAVLVPGEEAGTTTASIHTSLNVTGRPAQFGRSLLPEISGKLIAQFADNLAALISADGASAGETA